MDTQDRLRELFESLDRRRRPEDIAGLVLGELDDLEFVEAVWGDGERVGRAVIAATDRPPFGSHRFRIPFDATGKTWVRFSAWDSAGDGAFTQPVRLK